MTRALEEILIVILIAMSQDQPEIIFAHTTAVAADPNRGVTPKIFVQNLHQDRP